MQIEIQGIPRSLKSSYSPRLKSAQTELSKWKKLSREAHAKVQRGELFAGGGGGLRGRGTSDQPYGDADDRTRLLVGHEVLEDGTRWVLSAYFILCCSFAFQFPTYSIVLFQHPPPSMLLLLYFPSHLREIIPAAHYPFGQPVVIICSFTRDATDMHPVPQTVLPLLYRRHSPFFSFSTILANEC